MWYMSEEPKTYDILNEYKTAYSLGYKEGGPVVFNSPFVMSDIKSGWYPDDPGIRPIIKDTDETTVSEWIMDDWYYVEYYASREDLEDE